MADDRSRTELDEAAWAHIEAERFDQAEAAIREIIERLDPRDAHRRWHYCGLLADVLNSLDRADEATEMHRRALAEARLLPMPTQLGTSRYMLANQYLIYGDPRDALETTRPIPDGTGHVQCLLHAVAAQALWKLERHDEARAAARDAIAACPTDDRRTQLSAELAAIIGSA